MKGYGPEDVRRALVDVGLGQGDVVLVHAALWSLGRYDHIPRDDAVDALVNVVVDYFGTMGTVVIPAFSYSVCEGLSFDQLETPSEGMGIFAEALRRRPGTLRSPHPLQSVAASGRWAQDICSRDTPGAFNLDGPFDRMLELDARLLLFGTSVQAASLIHYVEERCCVPYRCWKCFRVTCVNQGITQEREYKMFVRDLKVDPRLDLRILAGVMRSEGSLQTATLGAGRVSSCTFADFCTAAGRLLAQHPCALLSNQEHVKEGLKQQNKGR